MASRRPFSLNRPIQSPAFPLFWIGNLRDLHELEYPSNDLTFMNSSTLQMILLIIRVLCQDLPLFFFCHLAMYQSKSNLLILLLLSPDPQSSQRIRSSRKTRKEVKLILLRSRDTRNQLLYFFIEPQDLQVLIIASKVDSLTSAIPSLAPCTDLHCSFFRYLTCLSCSTLQPDALHRLSKYPMDTDLQPNAPQSTRSCHLVARCITSAFLTDILIELVHSLMHCISSIIRLPTCSGNTS
jgi:hypothetical protein